MTVRPEIIQRIRDATNGTGKTDLLRRLVGSSAMTEGRVHQLLIAIVAAFCALGMIYSIAIPLFEAPDEIWHFSFVQTLATQRRLPEQPADVKDMWLREAGQPPLYYLVAALVVAPLDTRDFPSFVRFNVAHPAVTADSDSTAPNVFIHTRREAFPYEGGVLAVHVARLLSVLWGAATVVGTFLVAREVVPGRPGLALAGAAITAFNPQFISMSSVVNNDVCAACMCSIGLWLAIRVAKGAASSSVVLDKNVVSFGFVAGLAILTKMSALALLALGGLALGLIWPQNRNIQRLLARGLAIFGLAGLVGGWWYARNWMLYGDPLAWNVWMLDLAYVPVGPFELVRQFGHVASSYWSPSSASFPPSIFWALGVVAALAVGGWIMLIVRRDARAAVNSVGLLLAGTWFLLLFASLVRYMQTTPSDEGRLLFPAIAAFSLLLSLGLFSIAPRRWANTALAIVCAALFALGIASPFGAIAPRYALPLISSSAGVSAEIPFEGAEFGGVRLAGMDVQDTVGPGETADVTLYWEADRTPSTDLRVVVQLWTAGGQLVGQRDNTPAGQIYPPDLWRAGDVVRDDHKVPTGAHGPAICRVAVHVMAGSRLLGTVSSPLALRLRGSPVSVDEIARPVSYTLDGRIELIGYELPTNLPQPGQPFPITLFWRALAQMGEDYTVFVHLMDENGTLQAQSDGQPLNNDYPTSYWLPGEVFADTHVVLPQDQWPGDFHLLVGLYRFADGGRLPVYTAQGERVANDAVPLDGYQ